jgi:hypothetical protein
VLSLRETWTLARARKLLIHEIGEVMRETTVAAEERIDRALNARPMDKISELSTYSLLSTLSQPV